MSGDPRGRATAIDKLSVWAVRYALGRATYAVDDVAETLIEYRSDLSLGTRAVIVRDIEAQLAASNGQIGMKMDTDLWLKLRDAMRQG